VEFDHSLHRSCLFTVRLWPEELGDGGSEWRGRVQHVLSGEAHYFRDWPALVEALREMLRDSEMAVDGGAPES
jgi:hypothetical protein